MCPRMAFSFSIIVAIGTGLAAGPDRPPISSGALILLAYHTGHRPLLPWPDTMRDKKTLCVVEPEALISHRAAGIYFGLYFVLGEGFALVRRVVPEEGLEALLSE